ncbi:class I SAM-dependent methyltransferase [Nocardia sp. NPDC005366]|uniref:class I SAM-dependent methyltransferase n=1 Tax=Nocardia sp. NPDC005366 TaxID=3156878 RepID=UPI00339F3350
MSSPRDIDASRFAAEALAQDDPTGWFEPLYAAAADGTAIVPWDVPEANPVLVSWSEGISGAGRSALVVGCGLGRDAEYIASLGFRVVAFDISETAISTARQRFPESSVEYIVADLLNPPAGWTGAFDLVVESITVQSMPLSVRAEATGYIARMVAPAGELVVISGIRAEDEQVDGPPWPLTRSEVEAFAVDGLRAVEVEQVSAAELSNQCRWRAIFRRHRNAVAG